MQKARHTKSFHESTHYLEQPRPQTEKGICGGGGWGGWRKGAEELCLTGRGLVLQAVKGYSGLLIALNHTLENQ